MPAHHNLWVSVCRPAGAQNYKNNPVLRYPGFRLTLFAILSGSAAYLQVTATLITGEGVNICHLISIEEDPAGPRNYCYSRRLSPYMD